MAFLRDYMEQNELADERRHKATLSFFQNLMKQNASVNEKIHSETVDVIEKLIKQEQTFNTLWQKEFQKQYENIVKTLNDSTAKRLEGNKEIAAEFEEILRDLKISVENGFNKELTETLNILNTLNLFASEREKFMQTAVTFEKETEKFAAQVISFRQEIKNMSNEMQKVLSDMEDKNYDALIAMHKHIEEAQKIFLASEDDYKNETKETFRKILNETKDAFRNILHEQITLVQNSYFDEIKRFSTLTKELTKTMNSIDKHTKESYNTVKETMSYVSDVSKSHKKDLKDIFEAEQNAYQNILNLSSEKFLEELAKLKKQQEIFQNGVGIALDLLIQRYEETNKKLEKLPKEFAKEFIALSNEENEE